MRCVVPRISKRRRCLRTPKAWPALRTFERRETDPRGSAPGRLSGLSVGANDLFRTPHSREEILRAPLAVAERILGRIETIVAELHAINPRARVLLLGGYNPVPRHEWAPAINQYLGMWDATLASRFEHDQRVAVVKMADIVTPQRLSRHDDFHPSAQAYQEAAKRIATILLQELSAA